MIIDHRKSNQEISFKLGLMILDHFWLTDLSSRVSCTWAFSEICSLRMLCSLNACFLGPMVEFADGTFASDVMNDDYKQHCSTLDLAATAVSRV